MFIKMNNFLVLAGIVYVAIVDFSVHAVPFLEACPPDSILVDGNCVCDTSTCQVPTCEWELEVAVNATEIPGSCCPIYECTGCANDSSIEGKCPCALGAVINEKGICECVDKERHLVNGTCICNPLQCELPQICDRKHVPVKIEEGCCKKTRCVSCPEDSESTNLDSDDIDDHCVCLPCKNDCDANKTVIIKKKGTGFPGGCCDIYSCEPLEEKEKDCVVNNTIYSDGVTWTTADTAQECHCQNGLSLCTPVNDRRDCLDDGMIYKHTEKLKKEEGCTECQCLNGKLKCFSHYCEFKETKIKENESLSCSFNNQIYEHLQTWIFKDENCTLCQCFNGVIQCNTTACEIEKLPNRNECHPLSDCNKQCPNGFRINKNGCEVCKCNSQKISQILLNKMKKYNITMDELINILDAMNKTSTEPPSTTTTTTTSTTTQSTTTTTTSEMPLVTLIKRHGLELNQSTTEATVTQTYVPKSITYNEPYWEVILIAISLLVLGGAFGAIVTWCILKVQSKQQFSPNHYEAVAQIENNNTIKKTPLCYD